MSNSKDIRKLSRSELVDIIYQLKKSELELQEQVQSLQAQLMNRNLKVEKVGTLAEAAFSLSGFFDAAQEAANVYLEEIQKRYDAADRECKRIISEAHQKADAILQEAAMQRYSAFQPEQRSSTRTRRSDRQHAQGVDCSLPPEV
ncbi:MAG: hypothetical protein IKK75_07795 [Clostridia bacterium]|nr:hypothetical protein [Clostridia bacterium]